MTQVASVVVDGSIATERQDQKDPDTQLQPDAIAEVSDAVIRTGLRK